MKALVVLLAAIALASVEVSGQGDIYFHTLDTSSGIDVRFVMPDGTFASGPNLFVEVLAGKDANSLMPLAPLLPLNRTGLIAGYVNPLGTVYTLWDYSATEIIAYRAFQGSSWDNATIRSRLQFALAPVRPAPGPGPPPEVPLGTRLVKLAPAFPQGDRFDQWTWRGPEIPTSLCGIAFGGGLFVAVGDTGWPSSILTSADGHTWRPQVSPTTNVLNAVDYDSGLFVAVGQAGTIVTSTNGVNWVAASSGVTDVLTAICHGQGLFVVAGENGQVLSSSHGTHWERRESYTSDNFGAAAYGDGHFVIVGPFSPVLVSTNGVDWTAPWCCDHSFYDLTFGNNLFVGVFSDPNWHPVLTSSDGLQWNRVFVPDCSLLHRVAYGAGTFVAFQATASSTLVSHDGTNWTCAGPVSTNVPINRVAYGNGRFVAVGYLGAIFSSTDGITWTDERSGRAVTSLRSVTWGDHTFVGVGARSFSEGNWQGRQILSSPSGVSWADAPPTEGLGNVDSIPLNGVAYGTGKFVAVGSSGASVSLISTNGMHWFAIQSAPGPGSSDVVYGNGVFTSVGPIGVGPKGQIAISTDGLNWNIVGPTNGGNLWGVTFGQGRFVAVGDKGAIVTSTNSVDWTQRSTGTSVALKRVTYGLDKFVVVGESGMILRSQDGSTWTPAVSGTVNRLNAVAYAAGNYVVVGDDGTILTSTNAITWTARLSGTHNDLYAVTYGNDTFVAVGDHGTILQSGTQPFTIRFETVQAGTSGIELHILDESGRSFRIEGSTNLLDWMEIAVETQPPPVIQVNDGAAARLPRRFYRAVAP